VRLSPEIKLRAVSPPSERAEGPRGSPQWLGEARPAGVPEQGERTRGLPRNRRDRRPSSVAIRPDGVADSVTPGPRIGRSPTGANHLTQPRYPRASTRAPGDGSTGVGGPPSTKEAGERAPRNRWRGGAPRNLEPLVGNTGGLRAPAPCQRNNNGSRRWRLWRRRVRPAT
jgi:hypothetical protein